MQVRSFRIAPRHAGIARHDGRDEADMEVRRDAVGRLDMAGALRVDGHLVGNG